MISTRFADKLLFNQESIRFMDPADTDIPDVQFAMVFEKEYPTTFEEIYAIINDAKKLRLKGVYIDKNDYTYSGLIWQIWFAGSPEDVIIFSLKHEHTITRSQEEINSALNKARDLLVYYPKDSIDFCYVITRIIANEPVMMPTSTHYPAVLIRDVSNLINYTPNRN